MPSCGHIDWPCCGCGDDYVSDDLLRDIDDAEMLELFDSPDFEAAEDQDGCEDDFLDDFGE